MEAVDPHQDSLELLFDMVPILVAEMTDQVVSSEGSQIATSIEEKLCLGNIVFLDKSPLSLGSSLS
jgi:hypothetical protein